MAQPSILVLEDDEIIRALMVDVLEDFGAVVTSFASADEGMIYLERGDDPVDLIVSDIQMPGLLNGPNGGGYCRGVPDQMPDLQHLVGSACGECRAPGR